MAQRGRKSAASNVVVSIAAIGIRPTITPSRSLDKLELSIFNLIISDHHHLRSLDAPLLTTYVIACAKMLTTKDVSEFEKLTRLAMSLAVKLRLTPSAVMDPKTLGRVYADAQQSSGLWRKPWDDPRDDEDDDDADAN